MEIDAGVNAGWIRCPIDIRPMAAAELMQVWQHRDATRCTRGQGAGVWKRRSGVGWGNVVWGP